MGHWIVGIDLGGTKIALGLIDPENHIVARRRLPTQADDRPQKVVERMARAVDSLAREVPRQARITAAGICTPGPVDHVTGTLLDPPNIPALHGAPLRRMLGERLGLPVILEHDAKAAALGEFHFGAGRGVQSMVYIVLGTGVGAAVIIDGQLYRGRCNTAGEVGHITLARDGDLCSCGSRGCVETFLSGPRLAFRYQRALKQAGRAEPERALSGEQVTQLAAQGDPLARQIVDQAGEALGMAVATMAMILDIELYVIGSSVARAGDLLLEPARQAVPDHCYQSVNCRVRIETTQLWDDGPILGCGWLARQELG
jgi:glucokinase